MQHVPTIARFLAAFALSAAALGCGDSGGGGEGGGGGATASSTHADHGGVTSGSTMDPLSGTVVELADYSIAPANLTVPAGAISFAVKNVGQGPHNLAILDGAGEVLFTTVDIAPGLGQQFDVQLEPGRYKWICTLGGHESLGMVGELTVE